MFKIIAPIMCLIICLAGCRKQDLRTVIISVPGLTNAACADTIQNAFMRQPGIKAVRPDFEHRTMKVTYDSMVTARKNIEFTIADAGFDANDIPAVRQAAK